MERALYNKCKSVLIAYNEKTKDDSVTLEKIIGSIEYCTGCMLYGQEILKRIDLIISSMDSGSQDLMTDVYNIHALLTFIDAQLEHYVIHIDGIVKASAETLAISEQRDRPEYWLSSWHPEKVVNQEVFRDNILHCKKIWQEESAELKNACLGLMFMPPFGSLEKQWSILREGK